MGRTESARKFLQHGKNICLFRNCHKDGVRNQKMEWVRMHFSYQEDMISRGMGGRSSKDTKENTGIPRQNCSVVPPDHIMIDSTHWPSKGESSFPENITTL